MCWLYVYRVLGALALDSNDIPYVAYTDGANGYALTSQKFVTGSWILVGTAGFTSPNPVDWVSLAIDQNTETPFVAFQENGAGATVEK